MRSSKQNGESGGYPYLGTLCVLNVSRFFFPTFVSCYRFLVTFQFFSSLLRDSSCVLRFPLKFCAGNLRAARACPTFDRCVFGAGVRFWQRVVRDRNLFQERTQPETHFNTSVLFYSMFFSCTYFYLFCWNYSNANLRETFSLSKFLHEESNCIDLSQKGEWFLED